jgi:uncharacterized membrane protein
MAGRWLTPSLMAPAVVSWAAHLGWLSLRESSLAFMTSTWVAILFFAPGTRGVTRGQTAYHAKAHRASAYHSLGIGSLLGAISAVIGAFGGYEVRRRLVSKLTINGIRIALFKDLIAIDLASFSSRAERRVFVLLSFGRDFAGTRRVVDKTIIDHLVPEGWAAG